MYQFLPLFIKRIWRKCTGRIESSPPYYRGSEQEINFALVKDLMREKTEDAKP